MTGSPVKPTRLIWLITTKQVTGIYGLLIHHAVRQDDITACFQLGQVDHHQSVENFRPLQSWWINYHLVPFRALTRFIHP